MNFQKSYLLGFEWMLRSTQTCYVRRYFMKYPGALQSPYTEGGSSPGSFDQFNIYYLENQFQWESWGERTVHVGIWTYAQNTQARGFANSLGEGLHKAPYIEICEAPIKRASWNPKLLHTRADFAKPLGTLGSPSTDGASYLNHVITFTFMTHESYQEDQ